MAGDSYKISRVLALYSQFQLGKVINKQEAADYFGVNTRSIQRDIDAIRDFLAEQYQQNGLSQSIEYAKKENGYRLVTQEADFLSDGEMLAVCKILIESRAFDKEQLTSLLQRILNQCVSAEDKEQIFSYVLNEVFHYQDPAHPPINMDYLWMIAEAVKEKRYIEVEYERLKNLETVKRKLEPVGILFSEYYFYVMGILEDPERRKNFAKAGDPFPTIYRVDRIAAIHVLDEHFRIPDQDRFKEGEYKNKVQYMFGGEPQRVKFTYCGPSVEAVLDRLPTAIITDKKDGLFTVEAETFGTGILMWLLSQGSKVDILSPQDLRKSWLNEIKTIADRNLGQRKGEDDCR